MRLVAAFGQVARTGSAVLVGMDTPQAAPRATRLFRPACGYDACLGPAEDGGYWAIGLREPARAAQVIAGVPMSTSGTGAEQLRRLRAQGMRVQLLDTLVDVDTIETGRAVAELAPATEFAAALRGLDAAVPC